MLKFLILFVDKNSEGGGEMAVSDFGEEIKTSWSDPELKVYKKGTKYIVVLRVTSESAEEKATLQ